MNSFDKNVVKFYQTPHGKIFSVLIHDTNGGQALVGSSCRIALRELEKGNIDAVKEILQKEIPSFMEKYFKNTIDKAYIETKKLEGFDVGT